MAARAKILAAETAIKVTNDALQIWGAAGYSRDNPMERYVRDARMFAIAGGTAQVLRTLVASSILGRKLPQTRDGYLRMSSGVELPSTGSRLDGIIRCPRRQLTTLASATDTPSTLCHGQAN